MKINMLAQRPESVITKTSVDNATDTAPAWSNHAIAFLISSENIQMH